MSEPDWFEQFFHLGVGIEANVVCPQRKVSVRISRVWRFGLVCQQALPPLNGQRWLPCVPEGERTNCDGCPIQEASCAFLRNGVQPPTETEQWLHEMDRSAKRPPTMTVWDNGSGNGGG